MDMKNTLIQLNIRSNKDNLKDKKMKKSQLRNIIKEEMSEIKGMLGQIIDKINGN